MRVVLATFNRDKARELKALLAVPGLELRPLADFSGATAPEENGATMLDNARLKARGAVAVTGLPAIADDTGLEVDAIGGAPGVHSARFAGAGATYADNVKLLLDRLSGVPRERRGARFRTVCVMAFPDGAERTAEGTLEGMIATAPRGTNGFGYDPVFELPGTGRTLAELSDDEKNAISHRARAARALAATISGADSSPAEPENPAAVFGSPRPDEVHRPASYAIVIDAQGRVAVVAEEGEFHLPGGGAEPGESPEAALLREVREELARRVTIIERLPRVREHFEADGCRYRMDATMFLAEFAGEPEGPAEYELRWEEPWRIEGRFSRACHAWAVARVLEKRGDD